MSGVIGICVGKVGAFTQRFFSEVIASVITTACVAGATTAYLQFGVSSNAPAEKPPVDLAGLLSPMPETGATGLMRPASLVEVNPPSRPFVQPPTRPKSRLVEAPKLKAADARPTQEIALHRGEPGFQDDVIAAPLPPIDTPAFEPPDEAIRPVPPPEPEGAPEQAGVKEPVFGVAVPAAIPYGEDIARRMRGWTASVTGLLP
jgi:hypothetical protein